MKLFLEQILKDDPSLEFENLDTWSAFDISSFSPNKKLYSYQRDALKRISGILHAAFSDSNKQLPNIKQLRDKYLEYGCNFDDEFPNQQINRAAFWMATGSGKSIVLIKTIALIAFAMKQKLIPQKDIMLLLPREDLIEQFEYEINDYNLSRKYNECIDFIDLKNYEETKHANALLSGISVFYYRSDLLRDNKSKSILDYKSYLNKGNWYVFLDEAHRGLNTSTDQSKLKQHIAKLTQNGFLFNFSATFTDDIDMATCCYNFNLREFITAGFGKNILVSSSLLKFRKSDADEMSTPDKQLQILKSIITYCLVKNFRKENIYHNPLMVTYVNSVAGTDSDLRNFFVEIEKVASGKIDSNVFEQAKEGLYSELSGTPAYIFDEEKLKASDDELSFVKNITVQNIYKLFFNSSTPSRISWQRGESGKEILLKLDSSTEYFSLIKIGDADSFSKAVFSDEYQELETFARETQFNKLNDNNCTINLLMGSRSFYEGWDSNRPNVINLINMGGADAKKFLPQSLGRGIRIQPDPNDISGRKRLPAGNANKSILLETLFIYATDKTSVTSILDEIDKSSGKDDRDELEIGKLFTARTPVFPLFIATYKEKSDSSEYAKFACSSSSQSRVRNLLCDIPMMNLLLSYDLTEHQYAELMKCVQNGSIFQPDEEKDYSDASYLLYLLINHIKHNEKEVDNLRELNGEICHYKHISVSINTLQNNQSDNSSLCKRDANTLNDKIKEVKLFNQISLEEFRSTNKAYADLPDDDLHIIYKTKNGIEEDSYKTLVIRNLANHYYYPLVVNTEEKIDYIKHIINKQSEVVFIDKLSKHARDQKSSAKEWMFSKIDENLDKGMGMPYFDSANNTFRHFYPDFIFWINSEPFYEVYFVDPKGTQNISWEAKVKYFNKLFEDKNNDPKIFKHGQYQIKFNLQLLTDDLNRVQDSEYARFWNTYDGFLSKLPL